MERAVKFRGKRVSNGEWLYGDLMHDNPNLSTDDND